MIPGYLSQGLGKDYFHHATEGLPRHFLSFLVNHGDISWCHPRQFHHQSSVEGLPRHLPSLLVSHGDLAQCQPGQFHHAIFCGRDTCTVSSDLSDPWLSRVVSI